MELYAPLRSLLKRFFPPKETGTPAHTGPIVVPRAEHNISRANISDNALKVLNRLKSANHEAYLVGGGVRDLLLGREPKDFDVATSATPEEVRRIFRNCRLIGRRFRLAHVFFGNEIVEVATFRAGVDAAGEETKTHGDTGMLVRDNVYGTVEQDALRRDFTVNSLYYNIRDFSVVDYAGGLADLQAGVLRLIGDPHQRFREDPVRMLRAIRFAAKLGFRIDPASERAMPELAALLQGVPPARLFDECAKLFLSGDAVKTFELLRHYHLFEHLFPLSEQSLAREEQHFPRMFIIKGLGNTDERVAQGKPVTPAFLYGVLLWEPARERARELELEGMPPFQAMQQAAQEVLSQQTRLIALPRFLSTQIVEMWTLQMALEQRRGGRVFATLSHGRFRAAYDMLLLRAQAGEQIQLICDWWTRFQAVDEDEQRVMVKELSGSTQRRRRRPRSRKKGSVSQAPE